MPGCLDVSVRDFNVHAKAQNGSILCGLHFRAAEEPTPVHCGEIVELATSIKLLGARSFYDPWLSDTGVAGSCGKLPGSS